MTLLKRGFSATRPSLLREIRGLCAPVSRQVYLFEALRCKFVKSYLTIDYSRTPVKSEGIFDHTRYPLFLILRSYASRPFQLNVVKNRT